MIIIHHATIESDRPRFLLAKVTEGVTSGRTWTFLLFIHLRWGPRAFKGMGRATEDILGEIVATSLEQTIGNKFIHVLWSFDPF